MGAALANAKGTYYQNPLPITPHDEKVLQELTFYGLPIFRYPKR